MILPNFNLDSVETNPYFILSMWVNLCRIRSFVKGFKHPEGKKKLNIIIFLKQLPQQIYLYLEYYSTKIELAQCPHGPNNLDTKSPIKKKKYLYNLDPKSKGSMANLSSLGRKGSAQLFSDF